MHLVRDLDTTSMWNISSSSLIIIWKSFSSFVKYLSGGSFFSSVNINIVIQKVSLFCPSISFLVMSDKQFLKFLIFVSYTILLYVVLMLEMPTGGMGYVYQYQHVYLSMV